MADIWASAWKEGNGEAIDEPELVAIAQDTLAKRYRDATFFPSMALDKMIPLLDDEVGNPGGGVPAKKTPVKKKAARARG